MNKNFKPAGYNSVSPYLVVNGAQKLIDLLITIFDAKEKRKYNREDGSIMHMELEIDDSIIMIADATEAYPPAEIILHVYVEDVDLIYRRAIEAGCKPVEAPVQKGEDPDKRGSFLDFAGNHWSVSTQL